MRVCFVASFGVRNCAPCKLRSIKITLQLGRMRECVSLSCACAESMCEPHAALHPHQHTHTRTTHICRHARTMCDVISFFWIFGYVHPTLRSVFFSSANQPSHYCGRTRAVVVKSTAHTRAAHTHTISGQSQISSHAGVVVVVVVWRIPHHPALSRNHCLKMCAVCELARETTPLVP